MVSNTRLYGASIAFASGLYSLWSASTASEATVSAWLMGLLGVVVIVHGGVLLTDYAMRLGSASGPLMIGYSAVMLFNQLLMGTGTMGDGSGTAMGDGMGGGSMATGMAWDPGMVALAALMLASGVIMSLDRTSEEGSSTM